MSVNVSLDPLVESIILARIKLMIWLDLRV